MPTLRLFRHYIPASAVFLVIADFVLAMAALHGSISALQAFGTDVHSLGVEWKAAVFGGVMVLCNMAMGLYQTRPAEGVVGIFVRLLIGLVSAMVVLALLFFVFPSLLVGRSVLLVAMAIWMPMAIMNHLVFTGFVDQAALKRRVLVLGAGSTAKALAELHEHQGRFRSKIVGFVRLSHESPALSEAQMVGSGGELAELAAKLDVDEVVIAVSERRNTLPLDELLDCKSKGIDVIDGTTFIERETGKVALELLSPGWLVFSDGFEDSHASRVARRVLDVVAAGSLLLLSLPVMAVTALAILVESGFKGPILYRQHRVGENDRIFEVMKFRSMRVDAELDGQPRWAHKNDDRVTRVGRIIRRARIDELPQLFNVLKGDMGFVGPRPERPEFVEMLRGSIPFYGERHRIKPGLTGWAQLCYPYGASEKDAAEKLQFDLYYLKNRSIFLDLLILIQTVEVVLFGRGAR